MPVLGTPRPAPVLGGAAGTVSSSFLAREADLLAPGSLLIVTSGEGYAPEEMGPYVTVAREMPRSTGHERGQGHGTGSRGGLVRIAGSDSQGASGSRTAGTSNLSGPGGAEDGLVVDGEEVLVEMMDAETGLCLGRRVPIGDLRHSTSFFGRKLDMEQTTCKKVRL